MTADGTAAALQQPAARLLRHIVFIVQTPLNARDVKRNGIADMVANGVQVTVVDAKDLVNPTLTEKPYAADIPGVIQHHVRSFGELTDIKKLLERADFAICLMALDGSPAALKIYRVLSQAGVPYAVLSTNAFPGFNRYRGERGQWRQRIGDILKRFLDGQIRPVRSLLFRLPPRLLGVAPPTFIVYGGRASRAGSRMFPVGLETRTVNAHAMDYDIFLELSANAPSEMPYAVFVDEHIGRQRDILAMGARPTATPEDFYPKLRRFFDRVEESLGLDVVVAANPRSNYGDEPELFGNRRIEYGVTAQLISESRLVIGHRSTALGYAVMFRRPVALIATGEMYEHWVQRPAMDAFAKALGTPVRLIDDIDAVDLADVMTFDAQRYDRYREDYVKVPETPELPFWTIIRGEIENYLAGRNHARA